MGTIDARSGSKIGPTAAIIGAVLLSIGTYLHPMGADPNVPLAAFTEYAADRHWIASHLLQLFGIILMVAALVLLSRRMADGPAAQWAALGMAGAVSSLGMASALQAVDGVALKVMVDAWSATPEPGRAAVFQTAFGVRQIEVGLAGMTSLLFGLTASVFGMALVIDPRFPRWIGAIAIAGGASTAVAGVVTAYTGFSEVAMIISMPSSVLLMLWMIVLGATAWRRSAF